MSRFLTVALLILVTFASAQAQRPAHPELVDRRLWQYVYNFERDFDVEVTTRVIVEDLSRLDRELPVFGSCAIFGSLIVRIDPRALSMSDARLELLVYHELAHCVFLLGHINEPCSILRANGSSEDFARQFETNRACFIEHMQGLIE